MMEITANMKTKTYYVRTKDEKVKTKISPQFSSSLSKHLYLRRLESSTKRPYETICHADKDQNDRDHAKSDAKLPRREDEKILKRDLSWPSMTSADVSDFGSIAMNSATSSRCETPLSFLLSEDDFESAESNLCHSLTKFSIETLIRGLYKVLVHNKSYDEIQPSYHTIIENGKSDYHFRHFTQFFLVKAFTHSIRKQLDSCVVTVDQM